MHYSERQDRAQVSDAGAGGRAAWLLTRPDGVVDSVSDLHDFAEEWARETGGTAQQVMLVDSWFEYNNP